MKWDEFRDLLIGLGPDTALGRVVAIRAEDRKEYLENFTPDSNEWQRKRAKYLAQTITKEQMNNTMNMFKTAFLSMDGLGSD